jgi:phosphatidylcholine synthase
MNMNIRIIKRPLILAWGVHLFTATGALWGFLAIMATFQHQWQAAFFWLMAAAFVDSVDGTLARRFQVKGLTPSFDGALLDNIIDYQTYVLVPAIILYEANLLPSQLLLTGVALVVFSSAYQFCQADAKTDDNTFTGFPSYWNVVVLYLFLLQPDLWVGFGVILFCAIMVFVPIRYIYPSRMNQYRLITLLLTGIWGLLMLFTLLQYPHFQPLPLYFSLLYVVYYVGLSLFLMFKKS